MAKHRPSLEAMATGISPVPPSNVVAGPAARIARPRQDRPHVSLYLSKPVQRAIKQMALDLDRKPHDLLIEGVNLMLAHYGRGSIAEIDGGR